MTHKNNPETYEARKDNGQGILGLVVVPEETRIREDYPPLGLTPATIASEEAFIKAGQGENGDPIVKSRDYINIQENKYPVNIDEVDVIEKDGEVVAIVDRDGIEVQVGDLAVGLADIEKPADTR